jgi:hypothetical protein
MQLCKFWISPSEVKEQSKPSQNFLAFVEFLLRDMWKGIGLDKPVIERDGARWLLIQFQPDGTTRILGWGSYN